MIKKGGKNSNLGRKYVTLLGIDILSTPRERVLAKVRNFISHNTRFYIVTANPELILMAREDKKLQKIVNEADLSIPDGVGVGYAAKFLFGRPLEIIPGRKLFLDLIELANKKDWKVFFLGGEGNEAELAAGRLRLSYKKVNIETFEGPILDENGNPASEVDRLKEAETVKRINEFAPRFLFIAFGMPKQEKWVAKWLPRLNVGGAMVVGGTFNYISGQAKVPPKWMEEAGLEWLWRLIVEPWRAKRILRAAIFFPLRIFWEKIRKPVV